MAKAVTVIPASVSRFPQYHVNTVTKKRVAAYARVSTDTEEQLSSYEAQVDHYTRFIQGKEEWVFVDVYTDEGISATNTKKRDGFNRMIGDALAGWKRLHESTPFFDHIIALSETITVTTL